MYALRSEILDFITQLPRFLTKVPDPVWGPPGVRLLLWLRGYFGYSLLVISRVTRRHLPTVSSVFLAYISLSKACHCPMRRY